MALTYNYTSLAGIDKFTDIEHQETSRFAFVMMAIDMNDVTEKNVDEIVFRLLFAKQCNQNYLVISQRAHLKHLLKLISDMKQMSDIKLEMLL